MKTLLTLIPIMLLIIVTGCSSVNEPTTPSSENASFEDVHVAIGITGDTVNTPWGVYSGYVNTETLDAELLPSRDQGAPRKR